MISEDPKENIIELKYSVILNKEEYPPFNINLLLEGENKEKENVQDFNLNLIIREIKMQNSNM